jgi:hypothetical protein
MTASDFNNGAVLQSSILVGIRLGNASRSRTSRHDPLHLGDIHSSRAARNGLMGATPALTALVPPAIYEVALMATTVGQRSPSGW